MNEPVVDRCVCFAVSFETLKAYAEAHGADDEALRARFGCGSGCGLCEPYVREMLRTGQTRLPVRLEARSGGAKEQGE